MADLQLIARLKHYIAAGEAGTLVPQLTWGELRELGELTAQLAAMFESARVQRASIDESPDPVDAMDDYMRTLVTREEARKVERPTIEPGQSYEFYCEMQQEYEPPEKRLRRFTGQRVTVVRNLTREEYDGPGPGDSDDDFETSRVFTVRAQDGTEFSAHVEELSGWDRDLGQYFWPDGTYGPNHETWPLANERD